MSDDVDGLRTDVVAEGRDVLDDVELGFLLTVDEVAGSLLTVEEEEEPDDGTTEEFLLTEEDDDEDPDDRRTCVCCDEEGVLPVLDEELVLVEVLLDDEEVELFLDEELLLVEEELPLSEDEDLVEVDDPLLLTWAATLSYGIKAIERAAATVNAILNTLFISDTN